MPSMTRPISLLLAALTTVGLAPTPSARSQQATPVTSSGAQPSRPQRIDVASAKRALAAAIAAAVSANVRVSVAVVDANGDLVAFERMDGAVSPSILISQGKAQTALLFGTSTADLQDAIAAGRSVTATLTPPPATPMVVFPSRGGAPIVREGRIVAAVGVAGVGPEIEEVIAKAGADAGGR